MSSIEEIISSINRLRHDIKAEVIVADIIENGLSASDIVTAPDGQFKRRFIQDISKAEIKKLNNVQDIVEIHVARDGIYDTLPSGLFHEPPKESLSGGHSMASDSKKQRLVEKETRQFFQPFEHEIFQKLVDLELEERKILTRYSENLYDDIISDFWKLDKSLPKKFLSRLILLLHLAHKITGNLDITTKLLEIVIEEKVSVNYDVTLPSQNQYHKNPDDHQGGLGTAKLGVDFISGQISMAILPEVEFVIGPLENSEVEDYLEGAMLSRFINCFYGYFIPVEMRVETKVIVDKGNSFELDGTSAPILGYSTTI